MIRRTAEMIAVQALLVIPTLHMVWILVQFTRAALHAW